VLGELREGRGNRPTPTEPPPLSDELARELVAWAARVSALRTAAAVPALGHARRAQRRAPARARPPPARTPHLPAAHAARTRA